MCNNEYYKLKKIYKNYNEILVAMKNTYKQENKKEMLEYIEYISGIKKGLKISMNELNRNRSRNYN